MLIFVGTFEPGYKAGGPIKSMVELLAALPRTIEATLVTSDRDLGDTTPYPGLSGQSVSRGHHRVHYLDVRDLRQWLSLLVALRRTRFDLLYVNSLWSPLFTVVPVLARCVGLLRARALLLAPRGELSVGALGVKANKKTRFLRVWRPLLRTIRPVWHAATPMEQRDIERVFPWARTVVRGNSRGEEPVAAVESPGTAATMVFLSRICEMKNLALVLESLTSTVATLELDIFGPIEDQGYWARCQELIARAPANVRVKYQGMVRPDQVQSVFARYDASVLPTLGENFGHVIGESLSAGCPVVCSRNTPWTPVLEAGGGAALAQLDAESLAAELQRRAEQSPQARLKDKQRALQAYAQWRRDVPRSSVVELVLDDRAEAA